MCRLFNSSAIITFLTCLSKFSLNLFFLIIFLIIKSKTNNKIEIYLPHILSVFDLLALLIKLSFGLAGDLIVFYLTSLLWLFQWAIEATAPIDIYYDFLLCFLEEEPGIYNLLLML